MCRLLLLHKKGYMCMFSFCKIISVHTLPVRLSTMKCVILLVLLAYVRSAPMSKQQAMTYLEKYGYMPSHDESKFRESMMKFQEFMGLPMTGKMNAASETVMKMRRCGMPDMDPAQHQRRRKRYALQGSRWRTKAVTYKVTNYSSKLRRDVIDKELKESFDIWAQHLNTMFTPETSGKVNIDVGFFSGYHNDGGEFDGAGQVLAHAFYPIFGGNVHFDEDEEWTSGEERGTNFKQVAIHEIGHSLGLKHSNDRNAIMYPTYRRYIPNPSLGMDDITGIRRLYTKASSYPKI
ncbi:Peptidase [Oryctes borbonicus]|uniref:Peptidase n=1 Tax=Oryctes borbonicus TaxID=1629725 RepID=A0A0T6B4Y1_9SCAR|nr:Peptidase [Oryctes borbonicus]